MSLTNEQPELLPCPFCGSAPTLHEPDKESGHQAVECENKECVMSHMWPEVKRWNTRAQAKQANATQDAQPVAMADISRRIDQIDAIYREALRPAGLVPTDKFEQLCAQAKQANAPTSAEPVAWMWDQAEYREGDLRGRRWGQAFGTQKPTDAWMIRNLIPLYAAPSPTPERVRDRCKHGVWLSDHCYSCDDEALGGRKE